jgi:hypothetical protein
MAVVTVYPRHSKKCQRNKDKSARQYRRCKCPLWLEWNEDGSQFRKSAKTRTWEIANKAARTLEEKLDLKAIGMEPPKKADHISIQSAVDLYLKDMDQRGIKDKSKARRMLFGLRDYANGKNVILLKDVTARLLTEWRSLVILWISTVTSGTGGFIPLSRRSSKGNETFANRFVQ